MATGSIKQASTSTSGIITVIDNGGNSSVPIGSDIIYLDSTLSSRGGVAVNDFVTFDIIQAGPDLQAANVYKISGTGKVKQISTSTTGVITVSDNGGFSAITNGSDISYLDASLPGNGGVAVANVVSFDFVQTGPDYQATHLKKMNSFPPDQGTVKTGPQTSVTVDGTIVTLKGATVSGNVQVKNGGNLLIKPDDSGVATVIKKGLTANKNSVVTLYQSEIMGTVAVTNCNSFTATGGNVDSSLIVVNNAAVSIDGTTVDGDVVCNNSTTSAVVKNCNITGNLEMHNNTGCSQTDNTVGGTNSGCA